MRSCKLYEFRRRRKVDQPAHVDTPEEFPPLPVLPETLLCMELSVGVPAVGLDDLASVVLRDVGATLQIMRAAGKESVFCEPGPHRIEDRISELGVQRCLEALKYEASIRGGLRPEIRQAWNHAREIAENCRSLAEEHGIGFPARDAYLVGLFHELDTLPSLLGWTDKAACADGQTLVHVWSLPECVRMHFLEQQAVTSWTPWSELVRSAHARLVLQQDAASAHS